MRGEKRALFLFGVLAVSACGGAAVQSPPAEPAPAETAPAVLAEVTAGRPVESDPREVHLRNLRQLTFGGDNAEGYFSPDGAQVIFQSRGADGGCDQQYILDLRTGDKTLISSGQGRTTCGFFGYPSPSYIIYSTTERAGPACPPSPDHSRGYVWALYDYDVVRANPDGTQAAPIAASPHYDAEATIRFDGARSVFTSDRDGDLELYSMALDGSDVRRLTHTPGYDGGAFYSPDGTKLVWRASRPTGPALDEYRALLAAHMVRPSEMEIYVGAADGSGARQVTHNGAANFGPYFLPDNQRVIFASNVGANPREFDMYIVNPDAPADANGDRPIERVTFAEGFDGFPMFSPDGRWLVFGSNRFGGQPGETNLFIAEWVP